MGLQPTMRAAVFDGPGTALRLETILRPEPRTGEVLLQVRACGVCATDLHVIKGDVGFPTPCVLGHEVSGVVEAVGADVVTWAHGDQVVAAFLNAVRVLPLLRPGARRPVRDVLRAQPGAGHAV
jgi:D-arabinose 1-dehydrogenase-like Zn-dependent alcohol dehydrogenase